MLSDFTYDSYRRLLEAFEEDGRRLLRFRDLDATEATTPLVLIRHDVDFSPESALRMARVEADAGAVASYFFLFSSPLYNLFSVEHADIPRKVADLGHEIGLHYDVAAYERAGEAAASEELLEEESALLSRISGTEVRSIAMHNPSTSGADPFRAARFINAYDERFTEQMGYFSDSCGAWRDEFVECVENRTLPARFQVTIHPIYWSDAPRTRWETLDHLLAERSAGLARVGEGIRSIWNNHPGVTQHDRRIEARHRGRL